MTSNLGSLQILEGMQPDGTVSNNARQQVQKQLSSTFRPEFLNRIDDTIFFTSLSHDDVRSIIDLLLRRLQSRLAQKDLTLRLTDAAVDRMMAQGYDVSYGARPMKRLLQSKIETLIARTLVEGKVQLGDTLTVDTDDRDGFIIK
jgi:ATP-dependent Clp protease ATP-binding subunit ClpB